MTSPPLQIVRYATSDGVHVGVREGDRVGRLDIGSVAELLTVTSAELPDVLQRAVDERGQVRLLPPVDRLTEVWAAGVTYLRSSDARQQESDSADVYARVYTADRPELFFKSPAWRTVGDGEPIGIRQDSGIDVPEAELALVLNRHAEIVGATICNDVSSRTIEGQNPLYLPQAKIYAGSCAIGPGITPVWMISDLAGLTITARVERDGAVVFAGETSTASISRPFTSLIGHLFRHQDFPAGVVLATGTGIVPSLEFGLQDGDLVEVAIDELGTLRNMVRSASRFGWLTPAADRVPDE